MTSLPKMPKNRLDASIIDQSSSVLNQDIIASDILAKTYAEIEETSLKTEKTSLKKDKKIQDWQDEREKIKNENLKSYLEKVFWFVVAYCCFVAISLWLNAWTATGFHLSDTIFGFLITGSGISVVGLVATILKALLR